MPTRIHMNRIPGEQRIHVELTAHDINDILDDLRDLGEAKLPATRALVAILDESADIFGIAATRKPADESICPGHTDCQRCDITDPCPCCGLWLVNGQWAAPPDLRGGFWPNMTGGLCARCHLAVNRGEEVDTEHQVCAVIADGMRISAPERPTGATDEVLLHVPWWTSWDTQAYSAELGLPAAHLAALKAVLDAHLAQQAVDQTSTEGTQP